MFGFLSHAHPRLMHCLTLHKMLIDKLQKIKIMPAEVIALEPQAQNHHDHATESRDEATYIPTFELFTMEVAHGPGKQCIKTLPLAYNAKQKISTSFKNSLCNCLTFLLPTLLT